MMLVHLKAKINRPKTNPRQDKYKTWVLGLTQDTTQDRSLGFVLSWVCLGSDCLVLGLVLGKIFYKNLVLSWACHVSCILGEKH